MCVCENNNWGDKVFYTSRLIYQINKCVRWSSEITRIMAKSNAHRGQIKCDLHMWNLSRGDPSICNNRDELDLMFELDKQSHRQTMRHVFLQVSDILSQLHKVWNGSKRSPGKRGTSISVKFQLQKDELTFFLTVRNRSIILICINI